MVREPSQFYHVSSSFIFFFIILYVILLTCSGFSVLLVSCRASSFQPESMVSCAFYLYRSDICVESLLRPSIILRGVQRAWTFMPFQAFNGWSLKKSRIRDEALKLAGCRPGVKLSLFA